MVIQTLKNSKSNEDSVVDLGSTKDGNEALGFSIYLKKTLSEDILHLPYRRSLCLFITGMFVVPLPPSPCRQDAVALQKNVLATQALFFGSGSLREVTRPQRGSPVTFFRQSVSLCGRSPGC